MRKTTLSGIIAGTFVALAVAAAPASATYYITSWQTTSGWNSIDGCKVWREVPDVDGDIYSQDFFCGRDVGIRGKGTKTSGASFELSTISWHQDLAYQRLPANSWFKAAKVYHGNH